MTKKDKDLTRQKLGVLLVIIIWTIIICSSLFWNIYHHEKYVEENARIEARVAFFKDVTFRKWISMRKGVYAPVSKITKTNPYLKVKYREIKIPSGKIYTLINPAYMTRQIHELQKIEKGVLGHITSLKPVRPQNAPDSWERKALLAFEKGKKEITSLEKINNCLYMRLMRPLVTEKSCLRCHSKQGYKTGDIRGGISVSVPMAPLEKSAEAYNKSLIIGHAAIWVLGFLGIILWMVYSRNRILERKRNEKEMSIKDAAIDTSTNAIVITDMEGKISYANKIFFAMWRYEPEDIEGKLIMPTLQIDQVTDIIPQIIEIGSWYGEINAKRNDGTNFFILLSASIIMEDGGQEIGIIFSFADITMRKNTEIELKNSRKNLEERNLIMEKDLKIAQLVQKELIGANIPKSNYLNINYKYLPVEKIGGDYFTFLKHDDGKMGVFIGDVSGHGVAPALFHSLIKSTIERLCYEFCQEPSDLIQNLNKDLSGHMTSYFITAIYGNFEPIEGSEEINFTFSIGGHPTPILIRKNGDAESFNISSRMIGIDKSYVYEEKSIKMSSGDRIFLFTDGVTECVNEKKEMVADEGRLVEIFTRSSQPDLDKTINSIIQELTIYTGKPTFKDDIIIIGIEIK
ncbi:SpoIIE family protein phosphatase [Spirochaetota bacterium]